MTAAPLGGEPAPARRTLGAAACVDKDVAFVVDTDPPLNDRIDAAYRKYRRHGKNIISGVVNPGSRASTTKLVPR